MNEHSFMTLPAAQAATSAADERAARMRDRVLDAALEAFTDSTYGGSTVPQIAATAGVAVGSVYRSFAGKEQLANAVFQRAKARMLASVTSDYDPGAPAAAQVRAMWRGLAAYAASDPRGFAFLEHQQHAAYLDEPSRALSDRVERAAAAVVAAGQATGDVRDGDPDVLVALVFGAFVGLAKSLRASGTALDRALTPDLVASTGDAAWALLAAPSSQPTAPTPTQAPPAKRPHHSRKAAP
jgi:AcrR family transcriptional regulator